MSITDQEKEIFDKLREIVPNLVCDGVVCEEEYLTARYKILFIRFEPYPKEGLDIRIFFQNEDNYTAAWWKDFAYWTESILLWDTGEIPWNELRETIDKRCSYYMKKTAVINIRKTAEGYPCNAMDLEESIQEYGDVIKKQIEIYDPDIIICCETELEVLELYDIESVVTWKTTKRGIDYFIYNGRLFVDFCDPDDVDATEQPFVYYGLRDAMKELLSHNKNVLNIID